MFDKNHQIWLIWYIQQGLDSCDMFALCISRISFSLAEELRTLVSIPPVSRCQTISIIHERTGQVKISISESQTALRQDPDTLPFLTFSLKRRTRAFIYLQIVLL